MFLLALSLTAFAGPWVRPTGSVYAKGGVSLFQSDNAVAQGQATGLRYRSFAVQNYVEVGLPAKLQVVASLPFVHAVNKASNDARYTHTWTGDLTLEIDREIMTSPALAAGLSARIPTYRMPSAFERAGGLTDELLPAFYINFPELGDPSVDIQPKVLLGGGSGFGWLWGDVGPQFRTHGYAHGVLGTLNAGLWLVKQRLAIQVHSRANANITQTDRSSRQSVYVQGGAFYNFKNGLGIDASFGVIPWAVNSSKGMDGGIAMHWER
jgi:hypothetical protein